MTDPAGLFAAHRHRVFRYFCRAVGDEESARDLTQDLFLRVVRSSSVPNGDGTGWVFSIARNLALDHHRRRNKRLEISPLADSSRIASQDVSAAVNEALG